MYSGLFGLMGDLWSYSSPLIGFFGRLGDPWSSLKSLDCAVSVILTVSFNLFSLVRCVFCFSWPYLKKGGGDARPRSFDIMTFSKSDSRP